MTNGERLDAFLERHCRGIVDLSPGDRRYPRIQVRAVCAANRRAQGWAVVVTSGIHGYEIAYFRSWRVAVLLAFDTANYLRTKESA
ncbi:hypothetical protein [Nocardia sp. NPDC060249]|uniref:hypothetical protein n=1 Tax=Nocardia sp. NPDC060249 TaxID=3347082 RepID=UPI003655BB7B